METFIFDNAIQYNNFIHPRCEIKAIQLVGPCLKIIKIAVIIIIIIYNEIVTDKIYFINNYLQSKML